MSIPYAGDAKVLSHYKHLLNGKNIGFCLMRGTVDTPEFRTAFASKNIIDLNFYGFQTYIFPLYLYSDSSDSREANLNNEVLQQRLEKLGMRFWSEEGSGMWHPESGLVGDKDRSGVVGNTYGPQDIFDYIYAILHSPTYRDRYKEFLKIDFPHIPFTSNKELFWKLIALGREIRLLHLMEFPLLNTLITKYPVAGDNIVEKVTYDAEKKRVHINPTQYFDGVSEAAWNFPIGGYQPLQKWLKDRKGRTLSSDDLEHYQKIVVALVETKRLMGEIDEVIAENGGWPIA